LESDKYLQLLKYKDLWPETEHTAVFVACWAEGKQYSGNVAAP